MDADHLARFTRVPCRGEMRTLGAYTPFATPITVKMCSVCTHTEFHSPDGPIVRPPSPTLAERKARRL